MLSFKYTSLKVPVHPSHIFTLSDLSFFCFPSWSYYPMWFASSTPTHQPIPSTRNNKRWPHMLATLPPETLFQCLQIHPQTWLSDVWLHVTRLKSINVIFSSEYPWPQSEPIKPSATVTSTRKAALWFPHIGVWYPFPWAHTHATPHQCPHSHALPNPPLCSSTIGCMLHQMGYNAFSSPFLKHQRNFCSAVSRPRVG